MNERWVPAYARMFDPGHELAVGDPACQRWAWLDLCFMAQYQKGSRILAGKVVQLDRGELVASLRFLADRWNWSVKRVRTFLSNLEDPGIQKLETVRGTPGGTVYRIVNYDTYANPGHSNDHSRGTAGAHPGHKEQKVVTGNTKDNNSHVREVFEHWREVSGHTTCKLTDGRRAKITARLRTYSVEELKRAIDVGCADPFYRGENDRGKRYDFPETLLKNDSKVDQFLNAHAKNGKHTSADQSSDPRDHFFMRLKRGEIADD